MSLPAKSFLVDALAAKIGLVPTSILSKLRAPRRLSRDGITTQDAFGMVEADLISSGRQRDPGTISLDGDFVCLVFIESWSSAALITGGFSGLPDADF